MFFLQGVAQQSQDAIVRAKRLQDLQQEWRERLIQAQARAALLQLADHLFITPFLTVPQAQTILDVTYHSARANIERLVQIGILQQQGASAYGKVYAAHGILDAVGQDTNGGNEL